MDEKLIRYLLTAPPTVTKLLLYAALQLNHQHRLTANLSLTAITTATGMSRTSAARARRRAHQDGIITPTDTPTQYVMASTKIVPPPTTHSPHLQPPPQPTVDSTTIVPHAAAVLPIKHQQQHLLDRIQAEIGLTTTQAEHLTAHYEPDYLQRHLDQMPSWRSQRRLRNPAGFFLRALEHDWTPTHTQTQLPWYNGAENLINR